MIYPTTKPIENIAPRMEIFCFIFLFSLNNTTKAIPALTIKPAMQAPKPMPPIT